MNRIIIYKAAVFVSSCGASASGSSFPSHSPEPAAFSAAFSVDSPVLPHPASILDFAPKKPVFPRKQFN
jgi:hypothetical protein